MTNLETSLKRQNNPRRLENAHYIGILESCIAMLCLTNGINPETLMSKVLKDLTIQANMDTEETNKIIENRWGKRTFARLAEVHRVATESVKRSLENDSSVPTTTAEVALAPKSWRERMRDSAARMAQNTETDTVSTTVSTTAETDIVTNTVSPTVK
jgi:hypothetical protein